MEKSREINGWKAKNFKIKTEAGKHSRSNLLTTYDKVLRLQCILCSEGMYPASWELTIHRRMKKSRLCIVKKLFFEGALSRGLFRTFACGSFRSWTIQSTPSKLPHKNPNYIRDPSAPFLDRWRVILILWRTNGTFETSGTCGTRMRRNQKFFSSAEPEGGCRTTKDKLKESFPFGQLCPIGLISPISPRNAPAAPFDCPSR